MRNKISRLQLFQKKMEKRIMTIAKKGAISIVNPSDPREPTNLAYPHAHPNLLGVAVENEVSSSVGATERNKSIEECMSGAESSGNPNSTSTQDLGDVI